MLGQEVQCLKVLGLRLRDHTVVMVLVPSMVQVMSNMALDLMVVAQSYSPSGPCFPPCDACFPQMGHGMFGVFPNTFPGQMS
jgi:hypothetical protein